MFVFHKRCVLLVNLLRRHHTRCSPCSPPYRVSDLTRASRPDLPHGPLGPIIRFRVDRFHSVPAPTPA
ncbi:unnamed protein product [Protopolystoma xenopodis]|uniref:Uncharacterized protein n=1 Tax=Protopolystoma xenopodis TaxID=117903 RepID=A0A448XKT2_9PLAT|nr:unnamed protein product [Protopolystoma xenopodis]